MNSVYIGADDKLLSRCINKTDMDVGKKGSKQIMQFKDTAAVLRIDAFSKLVTHDFC